jgi:hypothetical protein
MIERSDLQRRRVERDRLVLEQPDLQDRVDVRCLNQRRALRVKPCPSRQQDVRS